MAKGSYKPVTVIVKSGNAENLKNVHLYLFDQQGELLESMPLDGGKGVLKTNAENIEGKTQMILGPPLPQEFQGTKLNPILMKKMGGYQPPVRLDKDKRILISGIPLLSFPLWNWCLITGSLTKTFNIDGTNQNLPVCDARVHICEIDRIRWWWPYIPIHIIDALGQSLKEVISHPKLDPRIVLPPRDPDPSPVWLQSKQLDVSTVKQSVNDSSFASMANMANMASVASEALVPHLPAHVKSGLASTSQTLVRDTILKNFTLLHPYLCFWPWYWPYFYKCDEIATVYTDCNGQFSFEYLNFTNDKDIYVWVEANINGQWVTVYRPSIPCHTKWNYACGSDIHINITDARVMPCNCGHQLHGELAWFRSIGEHATALHIEQDDLSSVNVQGLSNILNVGCTDITDAKRISPFGNTHNSQLGFKMLFGDGLPTANITHYRWKKTQIKGSALNPVLFPASFVVNGAVERTYFVITIDSNGHYHFETKKVSLGAEGTGENIGYRIPHWNIYTDPGVPAADKLKTIQWTSPDFGSAQFDSNGLADGLWRFDLELLFDNAGVFQVVEVPKQVFQVSEYNNSGDSQDAPDTYLKLNAGNPSRATNFQIKVRIDNAPCVAHIQEANITTVNGKVEYSGECGFLHYTDKNLDKTRLSFIASQPRNFARFSFSVVKGNNTNNPAGVSQNGYVISSVGVYTLAGGEFFNDVPAAQLIGNCLQAAFAENLSVYSLATNGTGRLQDYDASHTNAFALSNT